MPRVLSTRIGTTKTIGILPISKSLTDSLNITILPRRCILQLRQLALYAVVSVDTHKKYITFKMILNDAKFRKAGWTHPPHEHWKNINFIKLAQSWNELVYLQPRAVTDSNQRLYYKLPQHLEAHHKKTILWSSERATLANGGNFAARKALLAILEAPDNYANILPTIPLPEAIPDGELDLSVGVPKKGNYSLQHRIPTDQEFPYQIFGTQTFEKASIKHFEGI
ncbi:hypothetical protein C8R43DRAFT_948270 [Mycena crocata]|nr:hypothetical protein C8R43DRAFT_948270 [Mycena crocata]